MGIVLVYASLSSYFIRVDEWYFNLELPVMTLPPLGMTAAWSIVYIVNIIVIARAIFYKYYIYVLIPICFLGIANILWCACFFTLHALIGSFCLLLLQSVICVAVFIILIKEDCISMIFWQVNLVWYLYLLCIMASVAF